MDRVAPVRRALISVSNKAGLEGFVKRLFAAGVEITSTGGTGLALGHAGIPVIEVSSITGFPEIMDGRVKTLHPRVHGGLLAKRSNETHQGHARMHDIPMIDLLVVNLYPFEDVVESGGDHDACIETIDIGGPAMIRAAAKNHNDVGVVIDPNDYDAVATEIERTGGLSCALRRRLAAAAFAHTAAYDAAIAHWFAATIEDATPKRKVFSGTLRLPLRYGENPHQTAAFYVDRSRRPGVATAQQVQGKDLSYNNIADTDAAFELVSEFGPSRPAVAIIKHANPCGVACGERMIDAYEAALRCDPVSAFGGVIAINQTLDLVTARRISEIFTEVIVAPDAANDALEYLAGKKNLRILITGGLPDPDAPGQTFRSISGGFLVQSRDASGVVLEDLAVVTKREPSAEDVRDLLFAFRVAKHVKSNAIVYAKNEATVGIGAGQMSRVDSCRMAAIKAADAAQRLGLTESLATGSVVASDAFFPFADGLLAAVEAGARAVIQPGGSMRDAEVIAAADAAGIAMVFTGKRHFRH